MIEGLKPYADYKESEVPWIGRVPSDWRVERTKWIFRSRKELNVGRRNTNVLSLTLRGVVNNDPDSPEGMVPKDYATYQLFRKHDLVFKLIDLENIRTSRVGLVHEDGIMSSAYVRLAPSKSVNIRFFYFQFFDLYTRAVFNALGAGVRSTLGATDLGELRIAVPPHNEQAAIVRFLDHANRKIDGFIRAKRKLIGLLNEQKQAIIHRAVTRGLHPDVPLKPSGIPWLGDIPKHWEARAFARMSRVVRGSSPRPAGDKRFFHGDFMPWVTVGEVTKDREMYLKATETFLTKMGAERSTMFPAGTLILTNSGATLGVPKILELNACANDGIVAFLGLRPLIQKPFAYLFLSTLTQRLRDEMRQGGTQPNLNTGIVRRIVCPVPPIAEQEAILKYVEQESAPLNTAIARTEREIALMQEYRTRLTADLVTGKLDVREAAAKLPDLPADTSAEEELGKLLEEPEAEEEE
jgi:type I restriction enzyme S subunit